VALSHLYRAFHYYMVPFHLRMELRVGDSDLVCANMGKCLASSNVSASVLHCDMLTVYVP